MAKQKLLAKNINFFSDQFLPTVYIQHRVLAGTSTRNQGSIQSAQTWREGLPHWPCAPNLLALALLCRRVDALPQGRRVHRVVREGWLQRREAEADWPQMVPRRPSPWSHHGMLCYRCQNGTWRLASAGRSVFFLHRMNCYSSSPNFCCWIILQLGRKAEDVSRPLNPFSFFLRFILGTMAATYYVLVPIYMWIKDQIIPQGQPI